MKLSYITFTFLLLLTLTACNSKQAAYDSCMAEVAADELKEPACRLERIKLAGYDSWLECSMSQTEECTKNNNARWKAEVNVYNECMERARTSTAPTAFDCANLLQ